MPQGINKNKKGPGESQERDNAQEPGKPPKSISEVKSTFIYNLNF